LDWLGTTETTLGSIEVDADTVWVEAGVVPCEGIAGAPAGSERIGAATASTGGVSRGNSGMAIRVPAVELKISSPSSASPKILSAPSRWGI
jgi:hypothetical protein